MPRASEAGADFAKLARSKTGISLPTAVRMFPTPTVQDSENDGGPSQYNRNSIPLNALVKMTNRTTGYLSEAIPGSLNPDWVELLMGFPVGWTDLT
jgi:hypothetical protein